MFLKLGSFLEYNTDKYVQETDWFVYFVFAVHRCKSLRRAICPPCITLICQHLTVSQCGAIYGTPILMLILGADCYSAPVLIK